VPDQVLSARPLVPLTVAFAPEKLIVPKFASGKTPLNEDGAS
jgi:hypothetical protein